MYYLLCTYYLLAQQPDKMYRMLVVSGDRKHFVDAIIQISPLASKVKASPPAVPVQPLFWGLRLRAVGIWWGSGGDHPGVTETPETFQKPSRRFPGEPCPPPIHHSSLTLSTWKPPPVKCISRCLLSHNNVVSLLLCLGPSLAAFCSLTLMGMLRGVQSSLSYDFHSTYLEAMGYVLPTANSPLTPMKSVIVPLPIALLSP